MPSELIKNKLALLPAEPGCYLMKDINGEVIYVGKAIKLKNRVKSYFVGAHNYKTTKLVSNIVDFEYIVTGSEKEALLLEFNLIKKYAPRFNIMFMDDKSYPYIKLSKEKLPTLKVVRNTTDKKAEYFGPFPDSGAAYHTINLLNQLYPLRKCKKMPKKECLYYHIHQCLGPCINEIEDHVYLDMVNGIKRFLRGDVNDLLSQLKKEMNEASEALQFEKAQEKLELIRSIEHVTAKQQVQFKDKKDRDVFGYYVDKGYISIQGFFLRSGKILERALAIHPIVDEPEAMFTSFIMQYYGKNPLPSEILLPASLDVTLLEQALETKIIQPVKGDKLKLVDMVIANARDSHHQKFELASREENKKEEAMYALSSIFHKKITSVEMVDNSHISGAFNVSGFIVFKDGEPSKKDYRLYRLGPYVSDLDSMKEVIYRRYFRILKEKGACNDLLIVDGGWQQIEAAKEILSEFDIDITLAGLVKDDHHRTSNLMDSDGNIIDVKKDSALFFMLTQMQDEVHRFAISYHRKLRSKAMTKSVLDDVEGIGEVRKKEIWKKFKSLKNLKAASVEDLKEVVPEQVAHNLYEALHVSNTDQNNSDA